MNAVPYLMFLLLSAASGQAEATPWLLYSELPRAGTSLSIAAARPGERVELGQLDVLPGVEPYARLSPDGHALFIARHRQLNHPERSATLYRFDLDTRRFSVIADTADGAPPLPLGPRSVAWIETHRVHPTDEARLAQGELFSVEQSVQAYLDGERVELARFDHIYGAHFAGLSARGIVLYVVSRQEAAFYLLPLDDRQIDRAQGPMRHPRQGIPTEKADIESPDVAFAPSGIARLARAPAGPFARDFSVSRETLFFGSLAADRAAHALYALDLSQAPIGAEPCQTQLLETTGESHPAPLASGDALFFTRARAGEADRRLISRVDLTAAPARALPELAEAMASARARWEASSLGTSRREREAERDQGARSIRRELLRVRGQARVLAAAPGQDLFILQRSAAVPGGAGQDVEILWIDGARRSAQRLPMMEDGFHRAFGFAEVSP